MSQEVVLGNIMADCDDEKKLQKFYGELLGGECVNFLQDPRLEVQQVLCFCS